MDSLALANGEHSSNCQQTISTEKILHIASLGEEKELQNGCLDNLESKEIEK